MEIEIKRIYEAPMDTDGFRVLVDRLWPRGISKEKAAVDLWEKNIAPSSELRKWFHHDPDLFDEFREKYIRELENNPESDPFAELIRGKDKVTLLYSAKDSVHNNAVVLREWLLKKST